MNRPGVLAVTAAWLVHAFTAGMMILGVLALYAAERGDTRGALLWLALALFADGLDGPLARRFRVRDVLPAIDGGTLDLVVDYVTFVLVPAVLIGHTHLIPAPWSFVAVALILVSALYHYARTDLKTPDRYFNGFPAFWNVVAFYLLLWRPPAFAAFAVVAVFAALTFAPVQFVHPLRVREHRPLLLAAIAVWSVCNVALLAAWSARCRGWRRSRRCSA
ncbi:MAG: phosphatidylcholine/phosphatidylserine synthase [Candidatus Eremiobacteraeota bacterium]|nr:phosphatidylcholine/phosphatidylserine synthase [Candidatus Eremiobacteraeota bacterium]